MKHTPSVKTNFRGIISVENMIKPKGKGSKNIKSRDKQKKSTYDKIKKCVK